MVLPITHSVSGICEFVPNAVVYIAAGLSISRDVMIDMDMLMARSAY